MERQEIRPKQNSLENHLLITTTTKNQCENSFAKKKYKN